MISLPIHGKLYRVSKKKVAPIRSHSAADRKLARILEAASADDDTSSIPPTPDEISRVIATLDRKGDEMEDRASAEALAEDRQHAIALDTARKRWGAKSSKLMRPAHVPCISLGVLRTRWQADVTVYMDAIHVLELAALEVVDQAAFEKAIRDVRIAREAFMAARKRLEEHISQHGCV